MLYYFIILLLDRSYYVTDLDIWRREDYGEMASHMAGKLSLLVICV